MARSWRDYGSAERSDVCDIRAGADHSERAFVANVPFVTGLPAPVREGLVTLSNAPAPRIANAELWPSVVTDAQRLASDGWALAAICLGWSPLDLFGAVPDKGGDPNADGLAVKLAGRAVLAVCGSFATVRDGPGTRSFIYRGNNSGAALLWELGRGR